MLSGFFATIPNDIDDAAMIDGCSKLGVLFRIILPLAKPGIVACSIYIFIMTWQEFLFAVTFTNSENMRTIPVGLYSFIGEKVTEWGPLMAASMLACIPILIFFSSIQRQFRKGLAGAVKG